MLPFLPTYLWSHPGIGSNRLSLLYTVPRNLSSSKTVNLQIFEDISRIQNMFINLVARTVVHYLWIQCRSEDNCMGEVIGKCTLADFYALVNYASIILGIIHMCMQHRSIFQHNTVLLGSIIVYSLLKVPSIHFIGTFQISSLLRWLGLGEVSASILINWLQVRYFQ